MIVTKIISGGQTGVDIAAIDAAIELGIDWGGWVPNGRRSEAGPIDAKYDRFVEHSRADWLPRTYANIDDAHATLVIAPPGMLTGGTLRTIDHAKLAGTRGAGLFIATVRTMTASCRDWLAECSAGSYEFALNVAGPRASKWPGGYDVARAFLRAVLA